MENLNLQLELVKESTDTLIRVKKAEKGNKDITWEEVWVKIFNYKNTDTDKKILLSVKEAVETGEIGTEVDRLKKFTKAHALRLYQLLKLKRRNGIIVEMVANRPNNYNCVDTIESLLELTKLLEKEDEIAVDTETTGLNYDKDCIVGVSLTLPKADYHCYIPVRHTVSGKQLNAKLVFITLKPYLENFQLKKYFFNALFDFHMLMNEGIRVRGLAMDAGVACHLLNEEEPSYALKNLATKYGKYFGFEDKSTTYEELFGKGGFQDTPLDIGTVYACKDTHLTYKYGKFIEQQFEQLPNLKSVYYDIELPITEIVFDMERKGFAIDLNYTKEYTEKLACKLRLLENQLSTIFGNINISSNQQLAKVLYDEWGLKDTSNKRSVDKESLERLAVDDRRLALLLEYRKLSKLYNTYLLPLPEKIWKRDGRLHGKYKQMGTVTGRFSSNDPNLQNLPKEARPMFAAPKGKVLVGIDLSQIEPRVLAFFSEDPDFQYPYFNDIDLYSTLASKIFKKSIQECGDGSKYRKMMKIGLLAKMYGVSVFTMSKQLGIETDEAQQFMDDFDRTYPIAKQYMDSLIAQADTVGYVETICGRKRRFPNHIEVAKQYHITVKRITDVLGYFPTGSVYKEPILNHYKHRQLKEDYTKIKRKYGRVSRMAVNSVIQGSAADYMKQAMIAVDKWVKSKGEDWLLLGSVHDELILEIPETFTYQDYKDLDKCMTSIKWFKFPIKTDCVVMRSWGVNEVKVEEWFSGVEG